MDRRVAQVERALREIKKENTDDRRNDTELRRKYDQLTKDYDKLKLLEEQMLANSGTKPHTARNSITNERRQGSLRCYGCGEPGHFKSQCPNKVSARSSERNPRQNADALDGDTGTKTVRCTSVNVSGEGARRAYLRLRIQGTPCDCLLDTDSEVTLVPFSLLFGAKTTPYKQTLRAANGTIIPTVGRVALTAGHGAHYMQIDGIVTKHVPDVIHGLDWLRQHKACWDFATDTISIEGREYRLQARPANNWCRRVIVQDTTVVPAMTEMVINTIVQYNTLNDNDTDDSDAWSTEATEPAVGLRVSRALVPKRSTDVPVRMMNLTIEPFELKEGKVMSLLQLVTVATIGALPAPSTSSANLQVLR